MLNLCKRVRQSTTVQGGGDAGGHPSGLEGPAQLAHLEAAPAQKPGWGLRTHILRLN